MKWRHAAVALLCCVLLLWLRRKSRAERSLISRRGSHPMDRQIADSRLSQNASTITVCLLLSTSNTSLDRTVRILNHAYLPEGVTMHLSIVSPVPVAIRKDSWQRGNLSVFRNISLIRFRKDTCFVLIQDTMDLSPYFLYWSWRSWAERHTEPLLISGDAQGTGLLPHHKIWVRFVRSERALGNANASGRYFDFFVRNVADAIVLYPPTLDGYGVIRPEWQSMTGPEREPRLARVWDERFVTGAVFKKVL
jgi:hypothetical protein